jgi:hypothetical protein
MYLNRALYFRNLFGPATERVHFFFHPLILCSSAHMAVYLQALSAFIALSTLGNLLAGQFSQGRGMSLAIG